MAKLSEIIERWRGTEIQKPNWNSYQCAPVTDKALDAAKIVSDRLEGVLGINRAEPTVNGCVCLSDDDESVWVTITVENEDD